MPVSQPNPSLSPAPASGRTRCLQINLQTSLGGGEVYAAAFARTVAALGVESVLLVHPRAGFWDSLALEGVRVERLSAANQLARTVRITAMDWLVFHTFADADTLASLRPAGPLLSAFAHMPLYGRDPQPLRHFDLVIAVSQHVAASLHAAGIHAVHTEPLYGIAEPLRAAPAPDGAPAPLFARSCYDWDRRKLRDRLLQFLEPAQRAISPARRQTRRPGFTLGIVSRITPIKQFPLLFELLAPGIARIPRINLDVYGSGGYASVRDLKSALRPIADRVRFWGHQTDVRAVYGRIDALLTGLPEKEALGLNVLEAQACGVPVLAPDAPPFDETVLEGVTGLRYRDPRRHGGADFERCLKQMAQGAFRFDASRAGPHLAQFSASALRERVQRLVEAVGAMPHF